MNTLFSTVSLLLFPFFLMGQATSSIDVMVGSSYSYRTLSTSSDDLGLNAIIATSEDEVGKYNWQFGFNYNRKLKSKIHFRTGLRLVSMGYKTKETELRWGTQHDGMGGFDPNANPYPDLPNQVQLQTDYWFLELPLLVRYELNERKLSPFIEVGFSPSLYLTSRSKWTTNLDTEVNYSQVSNSVFNKLQVVGIASVGLSYKMNTLNHFFAQPIMRYHLTKQASTEINEHLYHLGLEVGLRRALN